MLGHFGEVRFNFCHFPVGLFAAKLSFPFCFSKKETLFVES